MHNTLKVVANNCFLNEHKLTAFARQAKNFDRFSLIVSGSELTISNWHVDGLIDAFKNTQSEKELKEDRLQAIHDAGYALPVESPNH